MLVSESPRWLGDVYNSIPITLLRTALHPSFFYRSVALGSCARRKDTANSSHCHDATTGRGSQPLPPPIHENLGGTRNSRSELATFLFLQNNHLVRLKRWQPSKTRKIARAQTIICCKLLKPSHQRIPQSLSHSPINSFILAQDRGIPNLFEKSFIPSAPAA